MWPARHDTAECSLDTLEKGTADHPMKGYFQPGSTPAARKRDWAVLMVFHSPWIPRVNHSDLGKFPLIFHELATLRTVFLLETVKVWRKSSADHRVGRCEAAGWVVWTTCRSTKSTLSAILGAAHVFVRHSTAWKPLWVETSNTKNT